MFSELGDKLQEIFRDLRGHGKISEENIDAALRQVRLALLEADVDFQVAKKFIARIKDKALGESVLRIITPDPREKNVQRTATAALEWHERAGGDINIFDTAGRQEVDVALIEELQRLKRFLQPQETLLVVDAATGQQAVSVATYFNDAL